MNAWPEASAAVPQLAPIDQDSSSGSRRLSVPSVRTTMTTAHSSRLFASGHANTLYATIPAQLVTDSQFPFEADADIIVTIDGDRLIITADNTEEPNAR